MKCSLGISNVLEEISSLSHSVVFLCFLYFLYFYFNIQKTEIMASGLISSWEIDGETVETVSDFILGGCKIIADGDCSHEIKRRLSLEGKL